VIDAHLPCVFGSEKPRTADLRPCFLRRALAGSGKPLIVTSDAGVLGDTGPVPLDEKAPVHPFRGFRFLPPMEREILRAEDVRGVVIRPALEHGRVVCFSLQYWISLAAECGRGTWLKAGKNCWSAVHSDDLADLYCLAIHNARPGMLLHGAAETVSMRDLVGAIHRGMGFPGEPAGITLADAQRLTIARAASGLCRSRAISGECAKRVLGWRPVRRSILETAQEQGVGQGKSRPTKRRLRVP
jgi:nucleoside-diphosphate-sugar epimerase